MTKHRSKPQEKDRQMQEHIPLPEAFLARMKEMLGAEFEAFLRSYEEESAYGLRYNPLRADREHFEKVAAPMLLEKVSWAQEGYYCDRARHPGRQILHEAGAYYIQEPSAMSAVGALCVREHERILDLCAAPGGKTTQIAGQLAGGGLLVANEFVSSRAKILSQNVERFGIRNCVVANEDPARLAQAFPSFFHKILVDAPCSGEGMFRKDVAARGQWSEENVRMCAERQLSLLEEAARMLMPGGRIVYSTCTFSREENEGVVDRFLQDHPDYELAQSMRLWPHRLRGEGHFVAVLQHKAKLAQQDAIYRHVQPARHTEVIAAWEAFAKEHLYAELTGVYALFGMNLYLLPEQMCDLKELKIERAGLHLGEYKKNRFEPAHALSHALLPQDAKSTYALSKAEAERYLRGETIAVCNVWESGFASTPVNGEAQAGSLSGWTLLSYEGYTLGWGKASGGRIKNHYPKGLRMMGWSAE